MFQHAVKGYHFRYSGIPGQIIEPQTAFQSPNTLILHTNKGLQLLHFHLNSGGLAEAPATVSRARQAVRRGTLTSTSAYTGTLEFADAHFNDDEEEDSPISLAQPQAEAGTSHSLAYSDAAPKEQRQPGASSTAPCSPATQMSDTSDLTASPSAQVLACNCQISGTVTVQGQQPSPTSMLCFHGGAGRPQHPCQGLCAYQAPQQRSPSPLQLSCPDDGMPLQQDTDEPQHARLKAAEPVEVPEAAPETSANQAQVLSHRGQMSVAPGQGLCSTSPSPEAAPVTRQGRSVWSMSSSASDSTDRALHDQSAVSSAQDSAAVHVTLQQQPDAGSGDCLLHNACVFGQRIADWVQPPRFGGLVVQVAGPLFDPEDFIINTLPHSAWRQMALVDYAMQTVHLTTSHPLREGQCSSAAGHQAVIVVAAVLQDKTHTPPSSPEMRAAVVTGILHFTSGTLLTVICQASRCVSSSASFICTVHHWIAILVSRKQPQYPSNLSSGLQHCSSASNSTPASPVPDGLSLVLFSFSVTLSDNLQAQSKAALLSGLKSQS